MSPLYSLSLSHYALHTNWSPNTSTILHFKENYNRMDHVRSTILSTQLLRCPLDDIDLNIKQRFSDKKVTNHILRQWFLLLESHFFDISKGVSMLLHHKVGLPTC
jgi:hypothetical protein